MAEKKKGEALEQSITVKALRLRVASFHIVGTAPLVVNKFSSKAAEQMRAKQEAGSQAGKGKKKEPKDFQACYEGAKHLTADGWCGFPAAGLRAALIDACRFAGFKMTLAKGTLFVQADGFDKDDGSPLVKIIGTPEPVEHSVRNDSGVADIRARPMWREWSAIVRIKFDEDQFSLTDVANLMVRAGAQVGLCEGRPFSKNSAGMGWGTFDIAEGK
jgi:hypothetical protein